MNELTIKVFEQYSTTEVQDPAGDLTAAIIDSYGTQYPGGLYGTARLTIPRDVTRSFPFRGGQRLTIYSGLDVVYEGEILNPVFSVGSTEQGVELEAVGHWGALMGKTTLNKPWADSRTTQAAWVFDETTSAGDKCRIDRQDGIKLIPTTDAWTSGEYAQVGYTAPAGQTIKKITYDYKLAEGTQNWEIAWYDSTNGKVSIATTSTTASSQTYTPTTPVQTIYFRMYAGANQTPAGNNTHIGKIQNITVYTETSSINAYEIALDVVTAAGNLNSDTSHIDSGASLSILPFITNGYEPLSDILDSALQFGDASGNSYAAYLREASYAATDNGKPVLVLEQYPSLDDYDYAIRIDEENIKPTFGLVWDFDSIVNYVVVQYRDENGVTRYVTPTDDSSLTDSDSVTAWGRRDVKRPLNAGETTETNAIAYSVRYLAANKDPKFNTSGAINVVGWIRSKQSGIIPASKIRAGMRIKIENFLEDLAQESGAGLTFLITRTSYNPQTETCSITTGMTPDDVGVWLSQLKAGF